MLSDVRLAIRSLVHTPVFALVAIATLALGLGATTAVFSVVHGVLLEPLPVENPSQLIQLRDSNPPQFPTFSVSPGNYLAWQREARSFESMGASATNFFTLTGAGEPERLRVDRATASLFAAIGVTPVVGRFFAPDEDRPGGTSVVVLSESLWRQRWAADPAVVGRSLILSGKPFTVIGVAPAAISSVTGDAQAWVPMAFDEKEAALYGSHYLRVLGRLRREVPLENARADLDRVAAQLELAFPGSNKGWRVLAVPLHDAIVAPVRQALLILSSAVAVVLMIVFTNVASLMLSRGFARQREMAVRVALGAARSRLVRDLVMEGAVLSVIAVFFAVFIARAVLAALTRLGPTALPRAANIELDSTVVMFAVAMAMIAPAFFALLPAVQASRGDLRETLTAAGRSVRSGARARTRAVLVTAQIALAVVLLVGCSLLVRSFVRLLAVDPGFSVSNVIVAGLQVPAQKYPDAAVRQQIVTRWLERVRALPGVDAAGLTQSLPLANDFVASLEIEGQPPVEPTDRPRANFYSVSDGFFDAMGIRLLQGRAIDSRDHAAAPRVVVINETFARRFYPDVNPLGRRIIVTQGPAEWREIIGVVTDTKQYGLSEETTLQVYESYQQQFFSAVDTVVRTSTDPVALTNTLRAALREIDPEQPLGRVITLQQILDSSLGQQRFSMALFGGFAAVSLLLAAIGLYGLVSSGVTQRRQEIGLRVALGATSRDVLGLVIGQALGLALAGIALGSLAAFAGARLMRSLLFATSPTDAATFAVVPLVLTVVATGAAALPAWRATRVDPLTTLRGD
jgi:putative ABC transport system permease protein